METRKENKNDMKEEKKLVKENGNKKNENINETEKWKMIQRKNGKEKQRMEGKMKSKK